MEKDAFIFVGRSGCGKGTQKDLLIKHLETLGMTYYSVYVGDFLREFVNSGSDIGKKYKEQMNDGLLAPSFVAVSAWGSLLMKDYKEGQSLIFDGSPRTLYEAYLLEDALNFLGFIHPVVISINVSNKWSTERLMARGRFDDNEADISRRLSWFDTTVLPAVNYFKGKTNYKFIDVNGEQTIPEVARDVMAALPYLDSSKATSTVNRSYNY